MSVEARGTAMRILDFEPDHLRRFTPQALQAGIVPFIRDNLSVVGPAYAQGRAFSGEIDGRIVGSAGVRVHAPGIGVAWALLSDGALRHPRPLVRACARGLTAIERALGLFRIEATVALGHGAGDRFITALGFEPEGLLENYGLWGVGDYILYARERT